MSAVLRQATAAYRFWTKPLRARDGRLKILWIEDLPDTILPQVTPEIDEYFAIISAKGPVDVKRMIEDTGLPRSSHNEDSQIYALEGLPCDVSLTDFRLCDKRNEGCALKEHLDLGLHAPSGGFLLGVLTAMLWPKHPQAIIPYSGYDEEFGQIWRLSSAVYPPALNVLWDDKVGEVGKGNRDTDRLIKLVSPQYRKALQKAFQAGVIHMPLAERDRWETLTSGKGSEVSAHEKIWLIGEYGLRPILVGGMFYDSMRHGASPCVPGSEIRKWLTEDVPVAAPLEREARRLAIWYWKLRCSPPSRVVYRIIRHRHLGVIEQPQGNPPGFPSLLEWKSSIQGKSLVRLAFLFLLIEEHNARRENIPASLRSPLTQGLFKNLRKLFDVHDTDKEFLEEIDKLLLKTKRKLKDKLEPFVNELREHQSIGGESLVEEFADSFADLTEDEYLPISAPTIIQLINPFPASWTQPLTLDKSKGVGRAISRLWSTSDKDLYDVMELIEGDRSRLTPSEVLCCVRYARELMPSEDDWPLWLKHFQRAT